MSELLALCQARAQGWISSLEFEAEKDKLGVGYVGDDVRLVAAPPVVPVDVVLADPRPMDQPRKSRSLERRDLRRYPQLRGARHQSKGYPHRRRTIVGT
jgi:hypothetical protein